MSERERERDAHIHEYRHTHIRTYMHTQAEAETPVGPGWSTKLQAVLDELDHVQTHFPGEKVVIFSQFTSFLDIIQAALAQHRPWYLGCM